MARLLMNAIGRQILQIVSKFIILKIIFTLFALLVIGVAAFV